MATLGAMKRELEDGTMAAYVSAPTSVRVGGQTAGLVEQLQEPLRQALERRNRFYSVEIDAVGRVGEVLVSITSSRGHLPLLFGRGDLEPGYVRRIVSDTVARFGL
jgi:hypothetical protein